MRVLGVTITRTEMVLVALALLVRGIYFASSTSSVYFDHPVLDALWIHQWAQSLAAGEPQPTDAYFRAPLYPHVVAGIYAIAGAKPWVVAALQHLLGALMVGLLYRLGRRVAGETVGIVAALLLAFYWVAVFFEGELLIVTLATALGLAFLLALAVAGDAAPGRRRTLGLMGAGILLGLAAIARPNYLILLPLALAWPVLVDRRCGRHHGAGGAGGAGGEREIFPDEAGVRRTGDPAGGSPAGVGASRAPGASRKTAEIGRRLREGGAVVVGILLPILPVSIRNMVVAGDPVVIASQGGLNLYVGNGPQADGKTAMAPGEVPPQARETYRTSFRDNVTLAGRAIAEAGRGRRLKESEVSRYWLDRTWAYVRAEPGAIVSGLFRKATYLINGFEISDNRDLREAQHSTPWLRACFVRLSWVLPLAFLGFVIAAQSLQKPHIIVYFTLLYSFSIVLFFVNARMRLPLTPALFVLAAIGWVAVWRLIRRPPGWRNARAAWVVGVLAAGAVVANARPFGIDERRALPAFRLNHAFLLLEQGECSEGLRVYDALVAEAPDMLEAAYQRARALQRCGDPEAALRAFTEVVRRWPDAGFAHLERGRVLEGLGRPDEAAAALRAGSEAAPHNPAVLFALGLLELRREQYAAAAEAYRRGLEIDSTELSGWFNYGYTLVRLGRVDAAREAFQRVVTLAPGSPEAGRARRGLEQIRALEHGRAREGDEGDR